MDKFSQIVSESAFAVVIAGTLALDRFELLLLDGPTADDAVAAAARRGLQFVGVIGVSVVDGQFVPRTAFAVEVTPKTEKTIAVEFVALFARVIRQAEQNHWLQTQTN
jgi:hypothetical protein